MFLPHIPAVIGTISSTALAAAQPPLYLGTVSSSGAGPFDFNDFNTGTIYPGRQLLFIVVASKDWNNSGPPGLSFSVNGGSALTPISTVSGDSGGLFSVGRTFSAFIVSNEDATVDFDCTSTATVALFRVFVYSLAGELTLTDTATGIGGSSTNSTFTTPLSPGAALIGFAMARSGSGSGGVTTASIHSPGGAGSTTYSWTVDGVSPPDAIDWTNITEDDQYGGIGNTNHGGGLWLLFEYEPLTSWLNPLSTGNRTATITVASSVSPGAGTLNNLVDGAFGQNSSDSFWWSTGSNVGNTLSFAFAGPQIINNARWYQSTATAQGVWQWEGSHDNSSWTPIGSTFTLGGATVTTHTELAGNTTAYQYYRMVGISGSRDSDPWLQEIRFKIDA